MYLNRHVFVMDKVLRCPNTGMLVPSLILKYAFKQVMSWHSSFIKKFNLIFEFTCVRSVI